MEEDENENKKYVKGVNIAHATEQRDNGFIEVKLVSKEGKDKSSWKEVIFQDSVLPLL